ncbi:hypothetical protein SAMN04490239_0757 [Rhodococcus koreensis]|uniref:Uncharacterized protein n=1 Tax=Rhodococcus koreensis TaxID=99653 RepID=A0A1H4IJW6_9NOCA|nr:hypothetical protein SAMN04490239_0757 [Rhodococcus koreensis]
MRETGMTNAHHGTWSSWRDVPEGVLYRSTGPCWYPYVNRVGVRYLATTGVESIMNDTDMDELAPFQVVSERTQNALRPRRQLADETRP